MHGLAQSGSELVLCLLLMEVSNPFLHARFMLKVQPCNLAAHLFILLRVRLGCSCTEAVRCHCQELRQGGTQAAAVNDVRSTPACPFCGSAYPHATPF